MMPLRRLLLSLLITIVTLALPVLAYAQSIPRLERTAGPCAACAPDGWTIAAPSPDVIVGDGPWPGGTYTMSDIAGGPVEGSNMLLLLAGTSSSVHEAVSTTITGLVPGNQYTLSIRYQGAKLASAGIVYQYGELHIVVGGTTHAYPTAAGDAWREARITFTATASTESVEVRCGSFGTGSYGGAVVADGAIVASAGANGASCTDPSTCTSGRCVDGVCCATACDGQCEACNVVGSVGTCTAVVGSPRGTRAACATDGSMCGGTCDGTRRDVCTYPSAVTICRAASCVAGTASSAAGCDGAGACPPSTTTPCAPYLCGTSACLTSCVSDDVCTSGNYCDGGACVALLMNGAVCTRDAACTSGRCVDGRCCDGACTGQCEACDLAGSEGTCSAVVGAPRGGRGACTSDGSVCGGTCDGVLRTACNYPASSTSCRAGSCTGGVAVVAASCDGAGACPAVMTQACAPYVCGPTECAGNCTTDDGCHTDAFCAAGMCTPRLTNGATCDRERQCSSGKCIDGVCCATACSGQCEACNVAGSEGVCTAVLGKPHGARAACATDGSECGGSCDGIARATCAYPESGRSCGKNSCTAGTATSLGTCDGIGSCDGRSKTECAPYVCGENACLTACDGDEDCVPGRSCVGGACVVAGSDSGVWAADASDAGSGAVDSSVEQGSCGCAVPGRAEGSQRSIVLALLALSWIARRRRR